jgi:uncharacterized membrane protein
VCPYIKAMPAAAQDAIFQAVITPHRSLSSRGLGVLVGAICTLSAATASLFWVLGAWPVLGFSGAETLAALVLLRHNVRGAREAELLLLSPDALHIVRTDRRGRREERVLPPTWLNVVLQERPGRAPALWLAVRGRREEVGAQLGADEKRDLARALRDALHRWRNPVFDNPQLRD